MEEFIPINPDYLRGFNEGYLIAKHMPELKDGIGNLPNSERSVGFQDGQKQLIAEREMSQRGPYWLQNSHSNPTPKDEKPRSNDTDKDR